MMTTRLIRQTSLLCGLITALAGCSIGSSRLTEYQAPSAVLRAFRAAYPGATDVEFREHTVKAVKQYEVSFEYLGNHHDVNYMYDGRLVQQPETPEK